MDDINLAKKLLVNLWAPKSIDEMVLDESVKKQFNYYINNREIPNLLLTGIQGSGKTTIANIILNELLGNTKKYNSLCLNGSKDNGIDIVRDKINTFCSSSVMGNAKHKIVFIDEADYLTKNAQSSLRNLIEQFQDSVRFLFTGNYISNFLPAIQSRFTSFSFKSLPKDDLFNHISNKLNEINVKFKDDDINTLIKMSYPDVRKIINNLQRLIINNELILDNINSIMDSEDKVYTLFKQFIIYLKTNSYANIKEAEKELLKIMKDDFSLDYNNLYKKIFDDDDIPIPVKLLSNDYSIKNMQVAIPSMNFAAFIYSVIDLYTHYAYKL